MNHESRESHKAGFKVLPRNLWASNKRTLSQVKHAFDDAAHAPKLAKIVNHVTVSQFFQVLKL